MGLTWENLVCIASSSTKPKLPNIYEGLNEMGDQEKPKFADVIKE